MFQELSTEEEVLTAMHHYIGKLGLTSVCGEDHCDQYKDRILGFTWSMVANFYKKIHDEIEFRKILGENSLLNSQDIENIFSNLHISRDDFEYQKKQTEKWLDRVRNHGKQQMGFSR